jgi:nicotinate-nucleotide--dimethylbenzimidazole phosphoribosyltransferase
VGDFLRELMPEEEQSAIELLGRIREAGEALPAPVRTGSLDPQPHHEPTMTIRQRQALLESPPEEQEPSVMTMPGAPAPLERHSNVVVMPRPVSLLPAARSRVPWIAGASAAVVALVLLVAAALVQGPTPTEIPARPDPEPHPEAIALAPKIAPKEEVVEPEDVEDEVTPPDTMVAEAIAAPKPIRRTSRVVPVVEKDAPPPPAPPPPPAAPASIPFAGIRRQLAQLRGNPKDVKLFDQVLGSIAQAARDLPTEGRRRVKVDLDAAERTYDVELLGLALDKLAIENAKSK